VDELSIPPASTRSARPLSIFAAAWVTASRAEPHCRSRLTAGISCSRPAVSAARRVMFPPPPTAFPPMIKSISHSASWYFSMTALSTSAPRTSAGTFRYIRSFTPIKLRIPPRIQTFSMHILPVYILKTAAQHGAGSLQYRLPQNTLQHPAE